MVEELVRFGIEHFVIAPGSRSAPLTLAIERHSSTSWCTHFDERGAGFFALGLAKGIGKPVAIVTTSGSAVANLLPAVIEARQTNVGLVLITADRPPELINCGANQAIRQPGIFSHFPSAELCLAAPDSSFSPTEWLASIDNCLGQVHKGPVHINCAFREPLYPASTNQSVNNNVLGWPELADCPEISEVWLRSNQIFTHSLSRPPDSDLPVFNSIPINGKRGVIVAGNMNMADGNAVVSLGAKLQWPVLADLHSHCRVIQASHVFARFGIWLADPSASNLLDQAEILLQFGGRFTDKKLQQWIREQAPREHWIVSPGEYCPDPDHRATQWINQDISTFVDRMSSSINCKSSSLESSVVNQTVDHSWYSGLYHHEQRCEQVIDTFLQQSNLLTESAVCRELSRILPEASQCFVGNSLPVRLMELFACSANVRWFSQRGASGIDGLLAHAFGVALSEGVATTLIIGDLSLLHDLNSLALVAARDIVVTDDISCRDDGKGCGTSIRAKNELLLTKPFVIIVLNNNGGNIFRFLPVPERQRKTLFQAPHGITFEEISRGFSISYANPQSLSKFSAAYQHAIQQAHATLIEVMIPENSAFDEISDIRQAFLSSNESKQK